MAEHTVSDRNPLEAILPLSPAQQGMLFESIAAPGSGIHIEQMSSLIQGALDVDVFARAWNRVVERHAILRTCFVWKDQDEPHQVILKSARLPIEHRDWRDFSAAEQDEHFEVFREADRAAGFRLSKAPLMRLALFRTGDETHRLVWTQHHILMDGWCQPLLLKEILALYRGLAQGREPELPATRPYRDYIRWLKARDLARAEEFWRRTLRGFDRPTPLGREAAAAGRAGQRYDQATIHLDADDTRALQGFAQRHQITLNTLVQGVWGLLLSRFSGQRDVLFGITVSGRPADLPGIESTVGLFINTLPIRLHVEPSAELVPWLREIQAHNAELREYEHTPGAKVRQWAEVPAALPLYESLLVYENYPVDPAIRTSSDLGILVDRIEVSGGRTRNALTLIVQPGPRLGLQMIHDRGRLESAEAARVLDALRALLATVARAGSPAESLLGDLLAAVPEERIPTIRAFRGRTRSAKDAPSVPPRSSLEEMLQTIWSQVFGIEGIGVRDDFFALGGHSLLAAEMVARLRSAFQIDLPLRVLFSAPTIEALAEAIAGLRGTRADRPADLPALVLDPARAGEPFPLTEIQQAYWVGRSGAFELGNVATHSYSEVEARGLDLQRLTAAWRTLIRRHGMLRAIVLPDGRQQVLDDVPPLEIPVYDWRGRSESESRGGLAAVREEMSHQVLTADRWPLFDPRASLLPDGRVRLHLSFDLLIGDGWSWQILGRELMALYVDPDAELPPLELSFRDYVLTEQALRETDLYRRSQQYWLERVPGLPGPPDLPMAKSPLQIGKPRFTRRSGRLGAEAWSRLKARGTRSGLTPSGLLLAAFGEVLRTWSASPRMTVNLTLFNRLPVHPQVNEIVGDFTSLTLLALDAWEPASFAERARRVQMQLWDDLDHRHFGGVAVQRELARRWSRRSAAVMPVVFTSTLTLDAMRESRGEDSLPVGVPPLEVVYSVGQTPQVWLDHQVSEHGGTLSFVWDAVEELFPEGLLDDMFRAYCAFLDELAAGEEAWTRPQASLLPAAERGLQEAVNATAGPAPQLLLHAPFLERAALAPDAPAVIAGEMRLSYGQLRHRSALLARALRESGARPNRLVAVVMEKGWEQVVAVLGILEAGAAYLPIDPTLPQERLWHLLERGEVELAVTRPDVDDRLAWPTGVRRVRIDPAEPAEALPEPLDPVQGPEDLAYVIFTSGSTGLPKGVMIDHRSALNTIADLNERFAVGPDDRVLALSSLSFDLSVYDIFGLLAAGGTIVLPEPEARRDPSRWAELVRSAGVTLWNSVPALLQMLVEYCAPRGGDGLDTLRLIWLSGDWIPVDLPDRARSLMPGARLISMGGATEAAIWSILYPIEAVDRSWRSIPYGRPMRNQRFHVLDGRLEPRPAWAPGDLYIGGAGLAQGYWRDEEKTQQSFVHSPWTGERLYRTGDMGRWLPDGNIEFLGRQDQQVKIRGHRIELGEIEAALEQHPQVKTGIAGVLGERGLDRRLVAYVVLESEDADAGGEVEPFPLWLERPTGGIGSGEALSLAALSRFCGLLRAIVDDAPLARHHYPSAGNLYPVQVYLCLKPGTANGVAGGLYYYHPKQHALIPLGSGRELDAGLFSETDGAVFAASSACLLLSADLDAIEPVYGGWAREFCLLEAGTMGQLLMAAGPEQGVVLCAAGGLDGAGLRQRLGLGERHAPLHALFVGTTGPWPVSGSGSFVIASLGPKRGGTLSGHVERLQFKLNDPGIRRPHASDGPPFRLADESPEGLEVLIERRSHRSFLPEAIAAGELGRLLGVLRVRADGGRVYPSPGGLYPVDVYLHVKANRVTGMAAGTYRYDPLADATVLLASGPEIGAEVHDKENQPVYEGAAFSLFLVARPGSLAIHGDRGLDLAMLEAGHLSELLMLAGPTCQIGLCPIGNLDFAGLRGHFGLTGDDILLHSLIGGLIERSRPSGRAVRVEDELLAFVRNKLPDYMVPSSLLVLQSIPLSANGKVDRGRLAAEGNEAFRRLLARSGATCEEPSAAAGKDRRPGLSMPYSAPVTDIERVCVAIWQELLGISEVGLHDDFFELGGHSLLAIQVLARLRQELQVDLPVNSFFERTTVAELASAIEAAQCGGADPAPEIEPIPRDGEIPLSFAQHRLWFFSRLEPESAAYILATGILLEGELDLPALRRSFEEVVARHEALRARFEDAGGRPLLVIDPFRAVPLPVVDLSGLAGCGEALVRRLMADEARRPFDLSQGPLLRTTLLRQGPARHVLVFTMHHIVSDAWSCGLMIQEVGILYAAFRQGRPSPLPELPLQYADYAAWQRRWLSGERLAEHLDYWRTQLGGTTPRLQLPFKGPRPERPRFRGANHAFALSPTLSQGLRDLGQREGVTFFMTMLAGFMALIHRVTGEEDIRIGTPVGGRSKVAIGGLIGLFVNTLVLRGDLSGEPTFRELLGQIRETVLGAWVHQEMPFDKLVEELRPDRDPRRSPLFQVLFNLPTIPGQASIELPGLTATSFKEDTSVALFDLRLEIYEQQERVTGLFNYDTDLFEAAAIVRMAQRYERLLKEVAADPDRCLADLPLDDITREASGGAELAGFNDDLEAS